MSKAGRAEIVRDDGANVRNSPAGIWRTRFPKGVRVRKAGECHFANGLHWEKIDVGYRTGGADPYGTVMLKDVQ